MADKQTAGRDRLGAIAPQFAALNDDVLFGEVWAREEQLSARDRSMITIAALFSAGLYPQLRTHLELGKAHGITREEAVEIVTQLAFYCGWPKAWSTFPMIAEIWGDDDGAGAWPRPGKDRIIQIVAQCRAPLSSHSSQYLSHSSQPQNQPLLGDRS